jgi:probable rRNA maturation factor
MKEQLSQIDLYVTLDNDELSKSFHQTLASIELDAFVNRTLEEAGIAQPVMLTLMVTDEATIQDMNHQYRQQNKPTDVLSFPLLDKPLVDAPPEELWQPIEDLEAGKTADQQGDQPLPAFVPPPDQPTNLGDIAISWPTVLRQAAEAGHTPTYEFLYLFAHGILHLVGYDDQTEAGYRTMVRKQEAILAAVGAQA